METNSYKLFHSRLKNIFEPVEGDHSWITRNKFVFDSLRSSDDLAIAGSIGAAIRRKSAKKQPGDIDIVANSKEEATDFVSKLEKKLFQMEYGYWRKYTNYKTDFVPEKAIAHIRLESALWLPICVFVLEPGGFKSWFTPEAYPVQFDQHIKEAAKALEKRDGKEREAARLDTDQEDEYVTVYEDNSTIDQIITEFVVNPNTEATSHGSMRTIK